MRIRHSLFPCILVSLVSFCLSLDAQQPAGSINGTTAADRPNRAGFGSGSFALGIPRAWQFALRVSF